MEKVVLVLVLIGISSVFFLVRKKNIEKKRRKRFDLLRSFFKNVFNVEISIFDIAEIKLPKKRGFDYFMIVPPFLTEDEIKKAMTKKWNISFSTQNLKEKEISSDKRPDKLYFFSHKGRVVPESTHKNKSTSELCEEKINYVTLKEYLLIQAFNKYYKGKFLDRGDLWTTTSSFGELGNEIICCKYFKREKVIFFENYDKLISEGLDSSYPREIIIFKF